MERSLRVIVAMRNIPGTPRSGSRPMGILCFAAIGLIVAAAACTTATPSTDLDFVTHASFFSGEMGTNPAVDPHAFVADSGQPAATGPQNIDHIAGFRPALLTDPEESPIYNAQGVLLDGFTLGSWLGAAGTVSITPRDGKATIVVSLRGLRPGGTYSLFENHFDEKPVGFTPLDGTGTTNSFTALAGTFDIDSELGRGGMATVYLAQDKRHERVVALKVLHPDLAATLGP